MNKLVYLLICTVFFSGFLSSNVHKVFTLIPEFLSFLILAVVLIRFVVHKSISLSTKYVVLGIVAILHVSASLIVNSVPPGTFVAGVRPYLKWLPVFILPMAYSFSDIEIRNQMRLVLGLLIIQFPITFYQRFIRYREVTDGDVITGTLGSGGSGALSILLLSAIAMVLSYYIRGKIRLLTLIFLLCVLFFPTTINETKVTLVLLPLAIIIPYIYASMKKLSAAQLAGLSALTMALVIGFASIYDQVVGKWNGGPSIVEFFMSDRASSYLYSEQEIDLEGALNPIQIGRTIELPREIIGTKEGGGRVDKLLLPINILSEDPIKIWFGLGVGNVSTSFIGMFTGEYAVRLGAVSNETLLTFLLWETGIGGVIVFVLFLIFLIIDAYKLSKTENPSAIIASGWIAVLVIALVTVPYFTLFYFNALVFMFAYFSGYVAAEAASMKSK